MTLTAEDRQAVRDICKALNAALIEDNRAKEQKRREGKAARANMPVELTTEEVIEDVEWLLSTREHPANIAKRVGRTPSALARMLHRRGRHDLAAPFERKTEAA